MVFDSIEQRTPGHTVVENVWRDKIAAALKKNGYSEVETEKHVPGGRIDIHFTWHAVEIDWSFKWAEGIGQALFYGLQTRSKAVVLLLLDADAGKQHVANAKLVAKNNTPPLQVWVLDIRDGTLDMGDGRTIHVE